MFSTRIFNFSSLATTSRLAGRVRPEPQSGLSELSAGAGSRGDSLRFSINPTPQKRGRRSIKKKKPILVFLVFFTFFAAGCKKKGEKEPTEQPELVDAN